MSAPFLNTSRLGDLLALKELKKSFDGKQLLVGLALDLVYVILIALLWYGYLTYSAGILNTEPGQFDDPALLLTFVQGIAYRFVFITLLTILATLLLSSIIKGWIYRYCMQQRYTARFFSVLFLMKTGWFLLWAMFLLLLLTIQQEQAFFWTMVYILLPLYVYGTVILSTLLDPQQIKKSLAQSMHVLFKIHRFIIPLIIISVGGVLLFILIFALQGLPAGVWYGCIALLFLAYLDWARLFFIQVITTVASSRITIKTKSIKPKGIKGSSGSISQKITTKEANA